VTALGTTPTTSAPTRVFADALADHVGQRVLLNGWLQRVRRRRGRLLLELRDRSGSIAAVALAPDDDGAPAAMPAPESAVRAVGTVRATEAPHACMLDIEQLELVAPADTPLPLDVASATPEQRLDHRYLDLRRPERYLVFAIQTTLEQAMRAFAIEQGFLELRTPKLSGGGSESGATTFPVPYFGRTASLVQSPQFYMQMAMAAGFDRVFEIGPVFRNERGVTPLHATEFTIAHFELSWIASHADLMDFEVALLQHALQAVADAHGSEIERRFGVPVQPPPHDVPRLPLVAATKIVGQQLASSIGESGARLIGRAEQALSKHAHEQHGHSYLFVTDYPAAARPFYTMRSNDAERGEADDPSRSFDLLWRGIEVTSGGQREHRYDRLCQQVRDAELAEATVAEYLDPYFLQMFRYGCPPHGGFGIGVNRLIMAMLGLPSLREASFAFRGPGRFVP